MSMTDQTIRFEDGAGYERSMGIWSRIAGDVFLEWLAPPRRARWIDVGCGNGAFTELLVERCDPAEVQGIDPSEGQLAFARTRPTARMATFLRGDAMALPFAAGRFDAAVMALVIVFVPEPAKGVGEMVRVVAPGGTVCTYMWDMLDGGSPFAPVLDEMRAMGMTPPTAPRLDASRMEALRGLWTKAGLESVETREIEVRRNFADYDDFWSICRKGAMLGPRIAALTPGEAERLKTGVRARLSVDAAGRVTCRARANAVKGRRPR
jgi:ubiquinone/menaquinone biosynthesis C-methylase UbiE